MSDENSLTETTEPVEVVVNATISILTREEATFAVLMPPEEIKKDRPEETGIVLLVIPTPILQNERARSAWTAALKEIATAVVTDGCMKAGAKSVMSDASWSVDHDSDAIDMSQIPVVDTNVSDESQKKERQCG